MFSTPEFDDVRGKHVNNLALPFLQQKLKYFVLKVEVGRT